MSRKNPTGIYTTVDTTQAQRALLFKLLKLGSVDNMYDVGELTADYYNQYVPNKTGELRASARVYANPYKFTISWGNTTRTAKYAGYQFRGKVFAPNIPIIQRGKVIGWFSRRGRKKYETNRELGWKHTWPIKGVRKTKDGAFVKQTRFVTAHFGYTTPGTKHHWTQEARKDISAWRGFRLDITKMLKEKFKESK